MSAANLQTSSDQLSQTSIDTAIILAAGMGTRIDCLHTDQPKGFIKIGGLTLIEHSIKLLQTYGIRRIILVTGAYGWAYQAFAAHCPIVQCVENMAFATTGNMASLMCALPYIDGDFLLLESDLLYESRALSAVLNHPARDVVLASEPTAATDEVWVEAHAGCLLGLSKTRTELGSVTGEFVGIVKVSSDLAQRLRSSFDVFVQRYGHAYMHYDTGGLAVVAKEYPISVAMVPDLLWGEVDYPFHYQRLCTHVWPAIQASLKKPAPALPL